MKFSPTYLLSWVGLLGIICAQLINLYTTNTLFWWPSLLIVSALIPIRGFILNQRYTFQWAGFLALVYLCVGVSEFFIIAEAESTSFLMLCSSIILYFGVVFHAKKLGHLASNR